MFGVQLYKNNARALLSRILSFLNLDWLQHARSVRGVYELQILQDSNICKNLYLQTQLWLCVRGKCTMHSCNFYILQNVVSIFLLRKHISCTIKFMLIPVLIILCNLNLLFSVQENSLMYWNVMPGYALIKNLIILHFHISHSHTKKMEASLVKYYFMLTTSHTHTFLFPNHVLVELIVL